MTRRKPRAFTPEFKAEAVRPAKAGDRRIGQVAKELDLTETARREWIRRADIDAENCLRNRGKISLPLRQECVFFRYRAAPSDVNASEVKRAHSGRTRKHVRRGREPTYGKKIEAMSIAGRLVRRTIETEEPPCNTC